MDLKGLSYIEMRQSETSVRLALYRQYSKQQRVVFSLLFPFHFTPPHLVVLTHLAEKRTIL